MLINKCRPQYDETIRPLQFCKLGRQMNQNAQLMGRLQLAAVECNYEKNRWTIEGAIHTWFELQ